MVPRLVPRGKMNEVSVFVARPLQKVILHARGEGAGLTLDIPVAKNLKEEHLQKNLLHH